MCVSECTQLPQSAWAAQSGWAGLLRRHPPHRRHPKPVRKTLLMTVLWCEHSSPFPRIHCEHQTRSPEGIFTWNAQRIQAECKVLSVNRVDIGVSSIVSRLQTEAVLMSNDSFKWTEKAPECAAGFCLALRTLCFLWKKCELGIFGPRRTWPLLTYLSQVRYGCRTSLRGLFSN